MRPRSKGPVLSLAAAAVILVLGVSAIPTPFKFVMALNLERRLAGLRLGAVDVGEHVVPYLAGGEGETLLLVHGFGGDKDNWTRFARHLTDDFHVVAPDLPGFGESSRNPNIDYSPAAQVERLHEIVGALRLDEFHVGGNSMGGMIAGLYAARHPEGVKSVALYAPAGVTRAEKSELQRMMDRGENPMLIEDPAAFEKMMHFVFVDPPWVPSSILELLALRAAADRELHEKVLDDFTAGQVPLEDELATVEVPLLVVWGDRDNLLHVSGAEGIRQKVPTAEIAILENVGHVPMIERPEESAEIFRRFARPQLETAERGS